MLIFNWDSLTQSSDYSKEQLTSLGNLSRWAFLFAFAGVGLRINFQNIRQLGVGPLIAAVIAKSVIVYVIFTLVLIMNDLGLLRLVLPQ